MGLGTRMGKTGRLDEGKVSLNDPKSFSSSTLARVANRASELPFFCLLSLSVSTASSTRIHSPLSIFRPTVRAILAGLTKEDKVLVEESFQRMLLNYDRVFNGSSASLFLSASFLSFHRLTR